MRQLMERSLAMIAAACALSVVALGSATAADLPLTPPQAQIAPPRYASPPPAYYPPAEPDEAYPPPVAYGYPPPAPPPTYYAYAPPPVVVVPQPYYWQGDYWGPRVRGPFIARGYARYDPPFERPYGHFSEHAWGRGYRGW
jgi:hypothetical protein